MPVRASLPCVPCQIELHPSYIDLSSYSTSSEIDAYIQGVNGVVSFDQGPADACDAEDMATFSMLYLRDRADGRVRQKVKQGCGSVTVGV